MVQTIVELKMVEKAPTRWSRYGLRGDPFFTDALEPDEHALYPITLFVGREQELDQMTRLTQDNDRSATIVYAGGGYGKTTLANRLAYDLKKMGFLVPPEEIQLSGEDSMMRFFRDLLSGILQALSDDGIPLPKAPKDPRDDDAVKYPGILAAAKLVRTIGRLTAAHAGIHATTLGGLSGGIQHTLMQPVFEPGPSRHLLRMLARDIGALEYRGILVRLNNIDEVTRISRTLFEDFIGQARDLLQVPGIHYVLLGNEVAHATIESTARVRGCFNLPIELQGFNNEQVWQTLEKRLHHLSVPNRTHTSPASKELVQALHRLHDGDLRNILSDLGRTVQGMQVQIEPKPAPPIMILPTLANLYHQNMAGKLNDDHWDLLRLLHEKGRPIRQIDVKQDLGVSEGTINTRFRRLEEAGAIEVKHRDGPSKFFRLTGPGKLALLTSIMTRHHDIGIPDAAQSLIKEIDPRITLQPIEEEE